MRYTLGIRIMHVSMLVVVMYQMLSSLLMDIPEPGRASDAWVWMFYMHTLFFGWLAFIVAGTYGMMMYQDPTAWSRLVPWFSRTNRAALFSAAKHELPNILRGNLALPEEESLVAGAIHGFGFLMLIAMSLTGIYLMLGTRSDGMLTADTQIFLSCHAFFGTCIWIFLAGHLTMAASHLALGHKRIKDIFISSEKTISS
ncbi:MAG: cytochrome b/b6 domain-containing protein [Mariprofundales bacterium]